MLLLIQGLFHSFRRDGGEGVVRSNMEQLLHDNVLATESTQLRIRAPWLPQTDITPAE